MSLGDGSPQQPGNGPDSVSGAGKRRRRRSGRVRRVLERLRGSLWFVPGLLVGAAAALALLMLWLDAQGFSDLPDRIPLLFEGDADSARSILSTIAGSMMTVAGVVFSITIVVLTLASSQYTPRVIRHFMRDRVSQTVLGVFLGVFTYCVLVLSTVVGGDSRFIPALAVNLSVLLAVVGLAYLVVFIHHIARAIQAAHILATAATETMHAVDDLYPDGYGDPAVGPALQQARALGDAEPALRVQACATGYLQQVDLDALLDCARAHDVVLRIERQVGEFVTEGAPLVAVLAATGAGDTASGAPLASRAERLERTIRSAATIAPFQTVDQDVAYGIRQMVDVALRALSPALNDETTAAEAIDYLGAVLARLAARPPAVTARCLDGQLRVIAPAPDADALVALAFDQIVRVGAASPQTLRRVLSALATVRGVACDGRCETALLRAAERVDAAAARAVDDVPARESLREAILRDWRR